MKHFYVIAPNDVALDTKMIFKLGIAHNPEYRLSQLQTGAHRKLRIWGSSIVEDARSFEKLIHQAFKDKRVKGEWFHLTYDDLQFIYTNMDNADRGKCLQKGCKYA